MVNALSAARSSPPPRRAASCHIFDGRNANSPLRAGRERGGQKGRDDSKTSGASGAQNIVHSCSAIGRVRRVNGERTEGIPPQTVVTRLRLRRRRRITSPELLNRGADHCYRRRLWDWIASDAIDDRCRRQRPRRRDGIRSPDAECAAIR